MRVHRLAIECFVVFMFGYFLPFRIGSVKIPRDTGGILEAGQKRALSCFPQSRKMKNYSFCPFCPRNEPALPEALFYRKSAQPVQDNSGHF